MTINHGLNPKTESTGIPVGALKQHLDIQVAENFKTKLGLDEKNARMLQKVRKGYWLLEFVHQLISDNRNCPRFEPMDKNFLIKYSQEEKF